MADPVGTPIQNSEIEQVIDTMQKTWDETKETVPWWKFWKKVDLIPLVNFLINCLDDLVAYVDQIVDTSGADKKATVLLAMGLIYDYVAKEALPFWLKPFSQSIRAFILSVIISSVIDWMINKYRNGSWRQRLPVEIKAQWENRLNLFKS